MVGAQLPTPVVGGVPEFVYGFNNNESSYVLGTSNLCTVDEERDLGVIIDKTLNQCTKVAAAANVVLGRAFNRKIFINRLIEQGVD